MDEKTLQVLDFPKMIALSASLAETERGRAAVSQLQPQCDRFIVENLLEETREGIELLQHTGSPLSGVRDVGAAVGRARVAGAMLPPQALLHIASTLEACQRLKTRFAKTADRLPRLKRRVALLSPLPELSEAIDQAIAPNEEVRDNASPELRRIRIKIVATQKRIREKLDSMLRTREGVVATQEQYITVRDGRYVLPVRSEMRSSLPGVIHDQSASGATVFIEPRETIELNNEVRQLTIEESREVERILRELTSIVGANADDLARNVDLLAQMDCILARARFSNLLDAEMPLISEDGRLVLKQARHPLLVLAEKGYELESARPRQDRLSERRAAMTSTELSQRLFSSKADEPEEEQRQGPRVIPTNISVGGDYRTLVITGPNTGGKTVALKTTGLLTLLAQAGFHIPAKEGSCIPLYQNVFADIGDEQGIEQSLSTFSSHMSQIVKIVTELTPHSLVLLDEIGAGTDPSEGSALAVAILRHLTESNVHTIATTHHNSLKVFAHSTKGVKNASVQFDALSLSPTYELVIGLPGSSNAFQIAKRLGLPPKLIEKAQSSLSVESRRVSELISYLDKQHSAVRAKSAELTRKTEETSAMQAELEKSVGFAKERSQQILEAAHREANELVRGAKSEIRSILASIRAKKSAETLESQDLDRARTGLDALEKGLSTKPSPRKKAKAPSTPPLTVDKIEKGMHVRMEGIDVEGVVSEVFTSKGEAEVAFGGIKVRSKVQSLVPEGQSEVVHKEKPLLPAFAKGTKRPSNELMLIGMTREEALEALEHYLEDAALWNLTEVRIVHGIGKGVLKAAVAEALREHKLVKSFEPAQPHLGGPGATVVTLKE